MERLRIVDEFGNYQDIETGFVPRIGERIVLQSSESGMSRGRNYFRVKDVAYHVSSRPAIMATILIAEEPNATIWLS